MLHSVDPRSVLILLCICSNISKSLFNFSTKIISQSLNAGPLECEALSSFIVKDDRKSNDSSDEYWLYSITLCLLELAVCPFAASQEYNILNG